MSCWSAVAYSHHSDTMSTPCEDAACNVDDIVRPFAGDHSFEIVRVASWRFAAYTHRHEIGACGKSGETQWTTSHVPSPATGILSSARPGMGLFRYSARRILLEAAWKRPLAWTRSPGRSPVTCNFPV